jgi:Domain of unknown function (DUF4149)
MKTFLRMFIYFAIVVWLGAELFFPIVAQVTFAALAPQTHNAGQIVGALLAVVHHEGVICAVLIAIALIGARHAGIYSRKDMLSLLALVVLMLGITVISEVFITPRINTYVVQAGGSIDAIPPGDPNRIAFEKLHQASVHAEEGVILFGLAFVVLLARAEGRPVEIVEVVVPVPVAV